MVSAVVDVGGVRDDVVADVADAILDAVDDAIDEGATVAELLCALGVVLEEMLGENVSPESMH